MSGFPFTKNATTGVIEHHPYNVGGLTTKPAKAPTVTDLATDWSTPIRSMHQWNVIRGDPLFLQDYKMKTGVAFTQTPVAGDCIAMKVTDLVGPLVNVGFETNPLTLSEIELCTGATLDTSNGIIFASAFRIRGKSYLVRTGYVQMKADDVVIFFRGSLTAKDMNWLRAIMYVTPALMVAIMYNPTAIDSKMQRVIFIDADTMDQACFSGGRFVKSK